MGKPEYQFSSEVVQEKRRETNYMHVIAKGTKLRDLQELVRGAISVSGEREIRQRFSIKVIIVGTLKGTKYHILIEHGPCPTGDGGEGHNVDIRHSTKHKDELSPIVAEEMRRYEKEMTLEQRRLEEYFASQRK